MKFIVLALTLCASSLAFADVEDNYNIRFSPLGLALGIGNARFDFKTAEHWTFGPSLVFWNLKLDDLEIRAFGASANSTYYFNSAFEHSAFIDGSLGFASFKIKDKDVLGGGSETAEASSLIGSLTAGYHWFWGNTFNLALGGGLAFNTIGEVEIKDDAGAVVRKETINAVSPALNAEIGFTF